MARCVRNFWLDADIDGKDSAIGTGPRNKDGGLGVTIKQRDNGSIATAITINCFVRDGELVTHVYDNDRNKLFEHVTKR